MLSTTISFRHIDLLLSRHLLLKHLIRVNPRLNSIVRNLMEPLIKHRHLPSRIPLLLDATSSTLRKWVPNPLRTTSSTTFLVTAAAPLSASSSPHYPPPKIRP